MIRVRAAERGVEGTMLDGEMRLEEVGPVELYAELVGPTPPLLLDVRTVEERALARIDPSVHLGLDSFLGRVHDQVPKDADVVVYCHSGLRSGQAAMWMLANGWTRVRNLAGGVDAWSIRVDPTMPRY
jgi:rhodanese-related sulfurtransferase